MNKKQIISHIIFISCLSLILSFIALGVKADSGFDTSYDHSSSSSDRDSSRSYDSSSSRDRDYTRDRSYNSDIDSSTNYSSNHNKSDNYSSKPLTPLDIIVGIISIAFYLGLGNPLVIIGILYVLLEKRNNKSPSKVQPQSHKIPSNEFNIVPVNDETIKKYIPNFERKTFLQNRFNDYVKIQEDYMNFNYSSLKENLTSELYNEYEAQLDYLKENNKTNIIKDIEYKDADITGIKEENNKIIIDIELLASQINYIEDSQSHITDSNILPNIDHYKLTFVHYNSKCPNCGLQIDESQYNCNNCGNDISTISDKYKLDKLENKNKEPNTNGLKKDITEKQAYNDKTTEILDGFLPLIGCLAAIFIATILIFHTQLSFKSVIFIVMPIAIVSTFYPIVKSIIEGIKYHNEWKQKMNNHINLYHSEELKDKEVRKYIKDFEKTSFLRNRFNDYKKVQEDWMNFNYAGLRTNLTDELFNQYKMQLETLKVKNQKNIMKNIKYKDSMITDITEENSNITITIELVVSQIDYIESKGKAIRGKKHRPMTVRYSLKYVLINNSLTNCPNCGAEIKNISSNKCEYCESIILNQSNRWIMSKKEVLKQK